MTVLVGGLELLEDALRTHLPELEVRRIDVDDPDGARDALAEGAAAVLSRSAHRGLAELGLPPDLPLICCLPATTPASTLRELTESGVRRLMFEPVDAAELAAEVRRVTGRAASAGPGATAAVGPAGQGPTEDPVLDGAIAAVWTEFRTLMFERLDVLEEVGTRLLEGGRELPALESARTAAHKLHGSLGTFGQARASELSAELEAIAERGAPTDGDVFRYAELVVALRGELEATTAATVPAGPVAGASTSEDDEDGAGGEGAAAPGAVAPAGSGTVEMLALESDGSRAEGLTAAALARGWSPRVAASLDELMKRAEERPPDVLIVDPASDTTDLLDPWLRRLALYPPRVPVLFCAEREDLASRLRAAALGVGAFVERGRGPSAVVDRAAVLLRESRRPDATILVVDDDPSIVALVRAALSDDGLRVAGLEDPLRFWEAVETERPDLVLLDIDMPHVSGIQLCRVLRASARWAYLPVIFFTGHGDRDTVNRAFRAGADDFVAKPMMGPELRSRVINRLDRMRMHRPGTDVDAATGSLSRRSAAERAATTLVLARRHDEPVTVAVVDVEGVADGGLALSRVAGELRDSARPEDIVARWSATELLVCLYGMGKESSAEWLRARVHGAEHGAVAVRIGTATAPADGLELDGLVAAARSAGVAPAGPGGEAAAPTRTERVDVVLVEDDEALAGLLLQTLDARDYSTRWISDGVEASRLLATRSASLEGRVILLDIGLPGLDGLTVLRRLAASGVTARSRVIMLTARSAEAEVLRALELGAFDHVPKPFSLAELLHRVRRALDSGGRST